jgi:hypothetical protein
MWWFRLVYGKLSVQVSILPPRLRFFRVFPQSHQADAGCVPSNGSSDMLSKLNFSYSDMNYCICFYRRPGDILWCLLEHQFSKYWLSKKILKYYFQWNVTDVITLIYSDSSSVFVVLAEIGRKNFEPSQFIICHYQNEKWEHTFCFVP